MIKSKTEIGREYSTYESMNKCIRLKNYGRKIRRKETTWNNSTQMGVKYKHLIYKKQKRVWARQLTPDKNSSGIFE
jgi:hypothetical protein